MNPPIPPLDLSQVPAWLISATTLTGILVFVAWPFLVWLKRKWAWFDRTGDLGLEIGLGACALVLYWSGVWLSTVLTPDVIAKLQPYYAAFPVVLGLMLALKLSRAAQAKLAVVWRAALHLPPEPKASPRQFVAAQPLLSGQPLAPGAGVHG